MFKSSYAYLTLYHVPLLSMIVFDTRTTPGCQGSTRCDENPAEGAGIGDILLALCKCFAVPVAGGNDVGGCCTQNSDCISGNCDTSTDVNPNGGINYRCAPATSGIEVEPL